MGKSEREGGWHAANGPRCGKDSVLVHGVQALPVELPWCPKLGTFDLKEQIFYILYLLSEFLLIALEF